MISKGIKKFEIQLKDACHRGYLVEIREDEEPRAEGIDPLEVFSIKRSISTMNVIQGKYKTGGGGHRR